MVSLFGRLALVVFVFVVMMGASFTSLGRGLTYVFVVLFLLLMLYWWMTRRD